jgi:hypothetical protein
MQPFDEVQPLSVEPAQDPFQPLPPLETAPLETAPLESYPLQQPEPVQLQPVEPLPALEPLQPSMPPPLPLLTAAEPVSAEPAPLAAPPVPSSDEVANLGVPLGTLIFRAGLLTEEQLEDALQEGMRSGKRLGEVLLESGLLDERDLGRLLADQKGLRFVELSSFPHDPNATALLSPEKAHMFSALPVGCEDGIPLVAVADPSNELVTENLRRALGKEPRLVVASRSDLHSTIDRLHATPAEDAPAQPEPTPAPVAVEPLLQVEPALEVEPVFDAVAPVVEPEAEPEPAPMLPPVQVEHVEAVQPGTNGYTTVAPLVTPEPVAAEPEPEPQPEPVLEPAALEPMVVEPEPVLVEPGPMVVEPEPVAVEPEPVAVEPEAVAVEPLVVEPVTVEPFVVPEPLAPVAPDPEPESELELTFSRVAEEPAQEPVEEFPSALSYDVSLRLSDGERVPIGSFGDPQKAREYARDVVRHLSDDNEGWPFFSGRFMRPDTILSVDIVPVGEPDRWLGSNARANWASRLNR